MRELLNNSLENVLPRSKLQGIKPPFAYSYGPPVWPDHDPHRFSKRLATRQPSTSKVKSRRPRHKVRTPGIPSLVRFRCPPETARPPRRVPECQRQRQAPWAKMVYRDDAFLLTQQHCGWRVRCLLSPVLQRHNPCRHAGGHQRSPSLNGPTLPAVWPPCDSYSSASNDTLQWANGRCISAPLPAFLPAWWRLPASTTTSAGLRMPGPGWAPTPRPVSTSGARGGGILHAIQLERGGQGPHRHCRGPGGLPVRPWYRDRDPGPAPAAPARRHAPAATARPPGGFARTG